MTVAAPPSPPQPSDPLELEEIEDLEALIEEARERARRRRRRWYAVLALAVGLGAVGTYFGLGAGGAAPTASVGSPDPSLSPGPPPGGFEVWFVRGHGPDGGGGGQALFPTRRTADELGISPDRYDDIDWSEPDPRLLTALLEALIAGPTPDDGANWEGVFFPDTQLLGVSVEDGIVTIDIGSKLEPPRLPPYDEDDPSAWVQAANELMVYRAMYPDGVFWYEGGWGVHWGMNALVFTVTQFPSVRGVQFKLDGRPVKVPMPTGDASSDQLGAVVDRPVTREDYEGWNGPLIAASLG